MKRKKGRKGVVYLMKIDNEKLRRKVVKGDSMMLYVKKIKKRENI